MGLRARTNGEGGGGWMERGRQSEETDRWTNGVDQDKDPPSPLSRGCRFDSFFLQKANEPVTEPWADQVSHHERHKDSWSVEREQGKLGGGEEEE